LEPRSPVADYTEKHFDDFGPKIPNWHSAGFEGRIYRPGSAKDDTGWPVSSVDRWTEFTTGEPKRDDLSPTYELNPLEQQPPGTEIVLYATTQASDPDGTTVRGYTQCGVIARKANGPIGDWIISIGNGADVPPYATPK
jgi:hypothetical protein